MRKRLVTFGICAALGCLVPVACTLYPGVDDDCSGTGTCALDDAASDADAAPLPDAPIDVGDGGNEGDVDGAVDAPIDSADTAPGCDPAGDPKSAPCIVTEANGLFVAPSGNDTTGDGSKAKPFATIGAAAPKAKAANKPRVFACEGTYPAALTLDATSDSVRIFGALDCSTWTYAAAKKTAIAPTSGVALIISGTTTGITIADVAFTSVAAIAPSESSIAAIVHDAKGVVLRRVAITAGAGADGTSGTTPTSDLGTLKDGKQADADPGTNGGGAVSCTCPFGVTSVGGNGGQGGAGADGQPGQPTIVANNGKTLTGGSSCSAGTVGANAAASANGAGATTLGTLAASTWTPTNGTKGGNGATGQGGGGGGGENGAGNGGGGGGCGGCGGEGAAGGTGGGASIALLAVNSTISIDTSSLTTAKGGDGGSGAAGQAGQPGAARGIPSGSGNGCNGGPGGHGANGGPGGGGAGGISAPIAWKGTQPSLVGSTNTLTPGTAGAKGVGGAPGANDGVVGMSGATIALP